MTNRIKQIGIICLYHIKLCIRSSRVIVLGLLLLIYLHGLIEPILTFSREVGYSPTPWFFPFLVNNIICQMILTFGGVVLFCDAPFHSPMENYLLTRTSYKRWRAGQILYIFLMSLLYIIFINFVSLFIMALGCGLEFTTRWGKIWGTLANTNAGQQLSINIIYDDSLYGQYTAVKAFAYTFLLEWGVISFLGLITYNLNRIKSFLGTLMASLLTVLDFAVYTILPFIVYRFSPVSWARLSILTGNVTTQKPSVQYAFKALLVTLSISSFLGILSFKTINTNQLFIKKGRK